jgi:hypothetical protein
VRAHAHMFGTRDLVNLWLREVRRGLMKLYQICRLFNVSLGLKMITHREFKDCHNMSGSTLV